MDRFGTLAKNLAARLDRKWFRRGENPYTGYIALYTGRDPVNTPVLARDGVQFRMNDIWLGVRYFKKEARLFVGLMTVDAELFPAVESLAESPELHSGIFKRFPVTLEEDEREGRWRRLGSVLPIDDEKDLVDKAVAQRAAELLEQLEAVCVAALGAPGEDEDPAESTDDSVAGPTVEFVDTDGNDGLPSIDYDSYPNAAFILIHPRSGVTDEEIGGLGRLTAGQFHPESSIDYYRPTIAGDLPIAEAGGAWLTISPTETGRSLRDIVDAINGRNLVFMCERTLDAWKVSNIYHFEFQQSTDLYDDLATMDASDLCVTVFEAQFCTP